MNTYDPSRGSYAPGPLRNDFLEVVESGTSGKDPRQLVGLLWNCTDVMPQAWCDLLEVPAGSSYAAGARRWKA
jgi:hypothetical protein